MDPRMHSDERELLKMKENPASTDARGMRTPGTYDRPNPEKDLDHTAAESALPTPRRVSRFDYVLYDEHATRAQREFKEAFINLEQLVLSKTGLCRAQALILTKLEEAYMWVGKAIRDDQVQRNQMKGTLPPLQEGRGNQ